MHKKLYTYISCFILVSALSMLFSFESLASMRISAQTQEEAATIKYVFNSDDEYEILNYFLYDPSYPSVRKSSCMRLAEIGSSYSVPSLEAIISNPSEDWDVGGEAAQAIHRINLRQSGDDENYLLPLIDIWTSVNTYEATIFDVAPAPFTPNDDGGNWVCENGVYKQLDYQNSIYHSSVFNDVLIGDGTVETTFQINGSEGGVVLCFRMSETENNHETGYIAMAQVYSPMLDGFPRCYFQLYKINDGDIDWQNPLTPEPVVVYAFQPSMWHTIRVELSGNHISAYIDGMPLSPVYDDTYSSGEVALATYAQYNSEIWFDYVGAYGSAAVMDFSDPTRTQDVILWAGNLLGDMGSLRARDLFETIVAVDEFIPYYNIFKDNAAKNITIIDHINSVPGNFIDKIEAGLYYQEQCVRDWALRMLPEQYLDDAELPFWIGELQDLLLQADADGDDELYFSVSRTLETLQQNYDRMMQIPIVIEYPADGAILDSRDITVMGAIYGEPFAEAVRFSYGINTYTKTFMCYDGYEMSETITVYCYNYAVDVSAVGSGSVSKSPDKAFYLPGEIVTLCATPNSGYSFTYWTGSGIPPGLENQNPLEIEVGTFDMDIYAYFDNNYALCTTVDSGYGYITKTPDSSYYNSGETVSVYCQSNSGSYFDHWEGDVPLGYEFDNPLSVTMDSDKSITARLSQCPTLEVSSDWNGYTYRSPESSYYNPGETVTIYCQSYSSEYYFDHWEGDVEPEYEYSNPAIITMDKDNKSVRAIFNQYPVLEVSSDWNGYITKSPDSSYYNLGETVTIYCQSNSSGYYFDHWEGDIEPEYEYSNPVSITIDENNRYITAKFSQCPMLEVSGEGYGYVTKSPDSSYYNPGETVTIDCQSYSDSMYYFDRWEGDIAPGTEHDNPIAITMDKQNKYIRAAFKQKPYLSITVSGYGTTEKTPDKIYYEPGEPVSVACYGYSEYQFSHWEGDIPDEQEHANPLQITMDEHKSITAHFNYEPPLE